ncbi:MAG: GAF domain-containing sensor histidine kinase [Anaerolineae bacterium]|nr:GAF domain-containing sensor histidine kinase [Anaerolineae bacterium]
MDVREQMYRQRITEMETYISGLERMLKVAQILNSTQNPIELLDIIVQVVTELTNTENASIMLVDQETGELHFVAVSGELSANVKPVVVPMEGSIAGAIVAENKPLLIRDAQNDPRWYGGADQESGFVTRSIVGVPMQVRGNVIGVLEAVNKIGDELLSWEDVEILTALANQAAIAIQNARLLEQLRNAYDELNQLDQMKSNFIAVAAHELRTPLSLILGYAMFLRAEASGETEEQLDIVLQGAMRLRSLIDDMVNLKEVESGESVLELETFPFQAMISSTLDDIRPLIEAKGQSIHLALPKESITIEADRGKMSVVLTNLLSNAIKFTDRGQRIGIQAGQENDCAWFTVWDTGIGIPKGKMNRIFDRFYQIEPSLARHYEGMGLGLSIVKAMVELHHGRIQVKSKEGCGSAFTVTIPLLHPGTKQKRPS